MSASRLDLRLLTMTISVLLLALGSGAGCSDKASGGACQDVESPCEALDDATCLGNTVQTCQYDADGCLIWRDADTCEAGFVCEAGECVCDDECAVGDSRCDGETIQICAADTYGCLVYLDDVDCADLDQFCDDTGDAVCVLHDNCGDDQIEGDEVCDGPDLGGATCETEGFYQGTLACESNCNALDVSGCSESCGDDVVNGPEDCDGTEPGGATCLTLGFYGGTLACSADCRFDTSGCTEYCGDGILNGPEACDGTAFGGATCADFGFYSGDPSCDGSCLVDASTCVGYCSDGVVNGPEVCDGSDLGGATCMDLGFAVGPLACDATCSTFITAACEICVAGQYHCEGNAIMQCDVGPPSQWIPTGTTCNAAAGYKCDATVGTCVDLNPIGNAPPNYTGTYFQYGYFTVASGVFLGGYDVDSYGDLIYVNRSSEYLDVYQVTLLDSDGDGQLEPHQHPDNPYDFGPIEQRVLTHITTYTKWFIRIASG